MNLMEHVMEIEIAAPPARVWKALTDQATAWWHPGFFSRKGAIAFVIEPFPGGRAYEDWGDGQGLLWYTVAGVAKGEMLQLFGDLDAAHGGPARLHTTFLLRAEGKGTVLRLEECAFGKVEESLRGRLAEGWNLLLGRWFKTYVETGAPPPA